MFARLHEQLPVEANDASTPVSRVRSYLRARAESAAPHGDTAGLRSDMRTLLGRLRRVRERGRLFATVELSDVVQETAQMLRKVGTQRLYFERNRNRA